MNYLRKSLFLLFLIVLLGSLQNPLAQAQSTDLNSAKKFVQDFYLWYLSEAEKNPGLGWGLVLAKKKSSLSPELYRLLTTESEAAKKASGRNSKLNFDPLLNSQDPPKRYQVKRVYQKGHSYYAEIFGIEPGNDLKIPTVIAQIKPEKGKWIFVNFYYPNSKSASPNNLVGILKVH